MRSGAGGSLQCDSMSGPYNWTKDGEYIDEAASGIDSTTVHSRTLHIIVMTQQLVGTYECHVNGQLQSTFDVKIIGRSFYNVLREFGSNLYLCCSVQG